MRQRSELHKRITIEGMASSRKGVGTELALLVLLVVIACSILLVSSAMLGKSNLNDHKDQMLERMALDQIAEQIIAGQTVNHEDYVVYRRVDNYWVSDDPAVAPIHVDDANLVITDKAGQIKLVVSWENGEITRWDYN